MGPPPARPARLGVGSRVDRPTQGEADRRAASPLSSPKAGGSVPAGADGPVCAHALKECAVVSDYLVGTRQRRCPRPARMPAGSFKEESSWHRSQSSATSRRPTPRRTCPPTTSACSGRSTGCRAASASTTRATTRPAWRWPTATGRTWPSSTRAIRNANDGLSTLQIKDGALNNISTLLDRLSTLAIAGGLGRLRAATAPR